MIRLFITEWDGRRDWLQTTAERDVVWSISAGDRGKLSCAHLNGECQFLKLPAIKLEVLAYTSVKNARF